MRKITLQALIAMHARWLVQNTTVFADFFHGDRSSYVNRTRVQSHNNNGFFKLAEALLQIHSCLVSHSYEATWLNAIGSPANMPRCLRSTVTSTCGKTPATVTLSETFEDSLPCYCYAINTNCRTIR